MERLQKYLARSGVASRRAAELLISAGRVAVNGRIASELGTRVDPEADRVQVDGLPLKPPGARVYLAFNKPLGLVTTTSDTHGRPTVLDFVPPGKRLFPVGRLDLDSEGLLLLTDDGELANQLMHPRYGCEKEYLALVPGAPIAEALEQLRTGIELDDGPTAPARVELSEPGEGGRQWLRITLREGRKRQIRRMLGAVGLPVERLRRVRIGSLHLGSLPPGASRPLSGDEVAALCSSFRPLAPSTSRPARSRGSSVSYPEATMHRGGIRPRPARSGATGKPAGLAVSKDQKSCPTRAPTMSPPTVIAIDGPVAAGKSTVAWLLARRLGYFYLDTGLLYRAVTWKALKSGLDLIEPGPLAELARNIKIRIKPPSVNDGRQSDVYVDGQDVSVALRSPRVEASVSVVSAHRAVREALIDLQRSAVRQPGTVVAGRDIGSVIFPDADVKIYLEAHPEERARRRLRQKGAWSESGLVQTLRDIQERDRVDSSRAVAPLQAPADSLIIDTDDLAPEQVVQRILEVHEARGTVDA